ncbi:alpha/beta fold hydrolase [Prauserella flavalba]|uniref:Hydrolase n=1 Tax=Prauserella flavalba TaxID=1477506 RepID=A0A318LEG1_9PSEU|nr:alpha/beta fold hydrolase [Prauserella flavalba]PXY24480.1 hydrolase [Prauserella flavalba]
MSTLPVNGITVGFDDTGSGTPLVLVHGHPFDRTMWRPQAVRFAREGWRVITPDLRGYGESTVVPGSTPLGTFARDIGALLDALGVERFVLGGLSMGGQIVLECLRQFPHRVRGLLLADTTPHAEPPGGRAARRELAERLLREGLGPYAHEVLPKMLAPHNIRALPATAKHVLRMMTGTSPEGAAAALRGRAERTDYVPMLADIAVPTLVVVGDEDEYTPVEVAKFLCERIPGAELTVIEGAAHLPNLEREVAFDDAVLDFLTRSAPLR